LIVFLSTLRVGLHINWFYRPSSNKWYNKQAQFMLRHSYNKGTFSSFHKLHRYTNISFPRLETYWFFTTQISDTRILFNNRQNHNDNSFLFQYAIYLYNLWESLSIKMIEKREPDKRSHGIRPQVKFNNNKYIYKRLYTEWTSWQKSSQSSLYLEQYYTWSVNVENLETMWKNIHFVTTRK